MAIKRFTIEIDDTNDSESATGKTINAPSSEKRVNKDETKRLEEYASSEVSKNDNTEIPPHQVGRTLGDILVEFRNDSRVMVTLLYVISFIIFVAKLNSIQNFVYPLLLGSILTIIWFIVPYLQKKFKNKST